MHRPLKLYRSWEDLKTIGLYYDYLTTCTKLETIFWLIIYQNLTTISPGLSIIDRKSRLHLFSEKWVEMTLKVDQGHRRCLNSIGHISLLLAVCSNHVSNRYRFWDIQRRKKHALEIWIRDHSRSSKMAPLHILYATSYQSAVVSIAISCTIFE